MIMRLINISIEWPLYTDQKVNLVIAGRSIPPLTTAIQFSTSVGSKQHHRHYMDFESIRTHYSWLLQAIMSLYNFLRLFIYPWSMQDFLPLHSAPPHQSTCHLLLPHPQQIEPWTAHKYRNQENKLYDYLFMDQEARTWAFTCSINLMYVVRDNTTSSYIPTIDFGSSTNNKNRTGHYGTKKGRRSPDNT